MHILNFFHIKRQLIDQIAEHLRLFRVWDDASPTGNAVEQVAEHEGRAVREKREDGDVTFHECEVYGMPDDGLALL